MWGDKVLFCDMNIELQYRTDQNNSIINDFFIPVLKHAKVYKRSVGFFTSNSLMQIANGLSGLISNEGKMYLIVSPKLNDEDIQAIKLGYKLREKVIEDKLLSELENEFNELEKEKLNYLAFLIYKNLLEIKVASMDDYGMYHEKIGVIEDIEGNKIAFTGSLNETENAFIRNFESIDVYKSWEEPQRIKNKERDFELLWNNKTPMIEVIDFPKAVKEKILEYKKDRYILEKESCKTVEEKKEKYLLENGIELPKYINGKPFQLRDYQKQAIEKWIENNYKGLFAMATGTGKTLTALAGVEKLWRYKRDKLAIIIVCPYIHLVDQWVDDIKKFNINPIKAYGGSEWKSKLKTNIRAYNHGINQYFCVITTNSTYKSKIFQKIILEINENILFIADEAHNFGSNKLCNLLNEKFEYRLALSATPERYFDEYGTKKILKYFDKQVFEFNLKDAIDGEFLTEYYYYPNIVYLNSDEYDEYKKISIQIARFIGKDGELDTSNEALEMLLLKRAKIINLAKNKISKLKELMCGFKDTYNNIVYCASGKSEEEKQINDVCKLLGCELNMKIHKFTSEETKEERKNLIERFEKKELQALVAIKCLDEGINIPCIERGFILSSTGNSKEFIQRRGRILRKHKNKKFSYIYDFIILPRPIEIIQHMNLDVLKVDLSLVNKELKRMKEFAQFSINRSSSTKLIDDIEVAYGIKY